MRADVRITRRSVHLPRAFAVGVGRVGKGDPGTRATYQRDVHGGLKNGS
jgi:hypothetical protein